MSKAKQIENSIFNIVKNSDIPISTREISLRVKKAWHTIDRHCLKLEIQGSIKGIRIGNINAWVKNK